MKWPSRATLSGSPNSLPLARSIYPTRRLVGLFEAYLTIRCRRWLWGGRCSRSRQALGQQPENAGNLVQIYHSLSPGIVLWRRLRVNSRAHLGLLNTVCERDAALRHLSFELLYRQAVNILGSEATATDRIEEELHGVEVLARRRHLQRVVPRAAPDLLELFVCGGRGRMRLHRLGKGNDLICLGVDKKDRQRHLCHLLMLYNQHFSIGNQDS